MSDSTNEDPLIGPRLKIERADQHIIDLKAGLKSFGESNPQRILTEYDAKTGRLIMSFVDCKKIPAFFSIIIGEILYQQRSALDHLIWRLLPDGSKPNKAAFPIFTTRDGYKSRKNAMIKGVSASAESHVEALQPFHRGGAYEEDPLWILQELNNTDKHRLLLVTQAVIGISPGEIMFNYKPPGIIHKIGQDKIHFAVPITVENGNVFCWFETETREVDVNGQVPIAIAFEEVGSTKLKPIFPLLTQLSDYVRGIIDAFSNEFN